jgi:F-type H+-transporting ATPase subunit b
MLSSVPLGVMLAGGSPIDLDKTFWVQLGILFVAFFILKELVFAPVMRLFDAREEAMVGAKVEAQQMDRDASAKRDHFEGELRKVRATASADRDKLRLEAQKLARELTEKARRESGASLASARARLDQEAEQARERAKAEIPALAKQIVDKLLDRSVH